MNKLKKFTSKASIIILVFIAGIFAKNFINKDINEIATDVNDTISLIDTIEIPQLDEKDEQATEVQESNLENETFEELGEIAYKGSDKTPNVELGKYKGLTYYSQADKRWALKKYGNNTMINSGCGPTAAAMVVSSIKGEILPSQMADLFVKYGYRSSNSGTYWAAMKWIADVFDIELKETSNFNTMIDKLENNNYVIAICRNGLFTYGGHFITIVGIDKDTLKIYDPYLYTGKYNTSTRRKANVKVSGNTVYVSKDNFKKYANAQYFYCYKNIRNDEKINSTQIIEKNDSASTKNTNYKVRVTAKAGLNIREGASTKYNKKGAYKKDSIVTIVAESNGWGRTSNGYWICLQYTTKISSNIENMYKITTGSKNLNIRKGPGLNNSVVGSYKKGTLVKITDIENGWGKTSKGWIYLYYTKKINSTTITNYTVGTYRATANLNVRSGPGTNYKVKTYKQLTTNARKQNSKLGNAKFNGYKKGVIFKVTSVNENWGHTASGWVCLNYAKKINL